MRRIRRHPGFTLIEVLVVLAIVGILAAIAYPSYLESVRKSRRAEARAALMQAMQQQERHYTQHGAYVAFSAASTEPAATAFKWFSGGSAAGSAYELGAAACDGETLRDCVIVSAMPGTARVDAGYRDPVCGTLTLDSTGQQTAAAAGKQCW